MRKYLSLSVVALSFGIYIAGIGVALASGPVWEPGGTKCMPNFRNDVPVGYLCVKVEPGSIYAFAGLQKGDNVTEINGQSMAGKVEDAIDLWKTFEKEEAVILVVERGDKTITLKKSTKQSDSPLLTAPVKHQEGAVHSSPPFAVKNGSELFMKKVAMSCLSTAMSRITSVDAEHVQIFDQNPECGLEVQTLAAEWNELAAPAAHLRTIHAKDAARRSEIIRKISADLGATVMALGAKKCPCVVFRGEGADQAFSLASRLPNTPSSN